MGKKINTESKNQLYENPNVDDKYIGKIVNDYKILKIGRNRGTDTYIIECIRCGSISKSTQKPENFKFCQKCFKNPIGLNINGYKILNKFKDDEGKILYKIKCIKCGNESDISINPKQLVKDGCVMCKTLKHIGEEYGKLKILEIDKEKTTKSRTYVICKCDCGNIKSIRLDGIIGGLKSCGCESKSNRFKIKHGLSRTRVFKHLELMKQRCYNQNKDNYNTYGGRGIRICDEWMDKENGLTNFAKWAYENGFEEGCKLQIDRINPEGNYEPSNCRWLTQEAQQRNKRNTKRIKVYDKINKKFIYLSCITEYSEFFNISRKSAYEIGKIIKEYGYYEDDLVYVSYYNDEILDIVPFEPIVLNPLLNCNNGLKPLLTHE